MAGTRKTPAPYPEPTRPGFWTGETLHLRLPAILGKGFDATKVEFASYRLRMGPEIFVSPADATDAASRTKRLLEPYQGCEIPPGQFALLITEETLSMPDDAIAFISMRSKATKFRGLVNVSGFHVDPGYKGKLVFAVFNAGPAPVHVARCDDLFVIFFADLDREKSKEIRDKKDDYQHIPSEHITPLASEFMTFQGLNSKIQETKEGLEDRLTKIERDNAIMRWAAALAITFFISFSVKSCVDQPSSGDPRGLEIGNLR